VELSPYSTTAVKKIIAMVKTLQHGGKLSNVEQQLFTNLVETEDEWFSRLDKEGKAESIALLPGGEWSDPLDLISCGLPKGKIRVALMSMKDGKPTFMDKEIANTLIDKLFQMHHAGLLEEEAIGRVY